ncbi:hypothetical protein [Parageobacillus sp. G301]|jgi:hypothetical protein|uniref:hypothetical protein n=1 Tax=Parageobacillus sp. G301 TaxID=2998290 RepID=UPI0024978453|nr:hypothetical protein [Parageobacillus sp. G301]GLH62508.1 hypothetical protein PG301_03480 [Parageobacillus sp. G301]
MGVMKKIHHIIITLAAILLFVFESNSVNAQVNDQGINQDKAPRVEIYDENNNLIKTINLEEKSIETDEPKTKSIITEQTVTAQSIKTYSFGNTTFSNYVWINGGYYFYNPGIFEFELINRPEAVAVEVYKPGQVYTGKVVWRNVTNWASLDWRDTTLVKHPGSYAFRFKNDGSGTVQIKHGNLKYNY